MEAVSGHATLQRILFGTIAGIGLNIFNAAQAHATLLTYDTVKVKAAVWNDTRSTLYTDDTNIKKGLAAFPDVPQGRVLPLQKAPDNFLSPDDAKATALRKVWAAIHVVASLACTLGCVCCLVADMLVS
jgi:hypothetical protein